MKKYVQFVKKHDDPNFFMDNVALIYVKDRQNVKFYCTNLFNKTKISFH